MGVIAWFQRERQWRRDHIAAFSAVTCRQADGLTFFQHQALSAVSRFVPSTSFKRIAMDKGEGEYLLAPLGRSGAELYIYPNDAAIFGVKPYAWFEEWDYRTTEDLFQALVQECASRAA
jgi:hypothetical protein